MQQRAAIKAIRSYLPATKLTNEELAESLGWPADKIYEKTGIRSRSVASPGECSSDLAVAAAERLFRSGFCAPHDIDFLLLCTETPDYFLPPTACLVQERLGLRRNCGALDVGQGCSGFVYGLALAKGLIETGAATNVLLVTAETYSKLMHPRDRSVRTIFGDGAAATLLSGLESDLESIGPFVFGTDGQGAPNLIVPAGAFRHPPAPDKLLEREDSSGNWRSPSNLYMNGPAVFDFTLRVVPKAVGLLLERCGLERDQIDLYVFHQANRFMLERLRRKLDIPLERFWLDMEECANTVSSTIPIALEGAHQRQLVRPGDRLLLLGFGLGYSWAATVIRWAGQ